MDRPDHPCHDARPGPTRAGSRRSHRLGGLLAALALATAGAAATGPAHAAPNTAAPAPAPTTRADAPKAAPNLLKNAGFENGLSPWSCSADSGTTGTPAHSGTAALKAAPSGLDNARCAQTVAVKPGSAYTLSAWVQGSYVYLGASGTGTTDVSTWTPGTGTDWKELTTSFTTGPNTTSVTVYTHGWYGQSPYLADDITLTGPGGSDPGDPGDPVPSAPGGLTAGRTTSSSVDLSWTPVGGATGYQVYRDGTKAQSVTGASATVTGLTPSTTYRFQVTAVNAAGESPRSAEISVTTAAGGQPPASQHAVTGYWQNFDNGAKVQRISDVQAQYDIIAVAFADATATPGAVDFTLDPGLRYNEADFKADIAAKRAAGKSVVISVGGERGSVRVNDAASAANFADSVYRVMQKYGFDGVDIDLENGLDPTYMTQALRTLSAKAGNKLVITMAPQTLDMQSTSASYFKTALNVKDILTVVNTQYYNSGSMLGCDGKVYAQGSVDFLTALACIQLEGGLAPSQVGLGLPASPRGAGSGYVDPAVVNNALDCLAKGTGCGSFKPAKTYPGIRGAMTWSTNWDASNGNAWSNVVGPHVHGLP
ncbi:chitinase [Streptomyces sp. NPDC021100]|uniref:chitinase n=1 Tax=Streptomyces sp. NPDC021100 TaxID=3365114 RepID=UPI0037B27276